MDNWAYGGAPYRLPEKFGLADTIGRKPRCEVGVFIFGQPGFHNAAAVGRIVFLSHGRDLLSCRMSAAGISGASGSDRNYTNLNIIIGLDLCIKWRKKSSP